MMLPAEIIFWVCVAALIYIHIGYLLTLELLARIYSSHPKQGSIFPRVSFIIPVFNEGEGIRRKIENLKALDYPSDLVEIIVVSDASTDDTAEICRSIDGIQFLELPDRGGKPAALNAGIEVASGEVIAFTDAAAMLEPDALTQAVRFFADSRVGCVSSEDIVTSEGGTGDGEGLYSRIDTLTRRLESVVASATGMNGSFYLVRRDLCGLFPLDVATDMYSALHCVDHGFRAAVQPDSRVRLSAQPDLVREFNRKVRTMVTGLRALYTFLHLFDPFRTGIFSWCLTSHKIMRYMTPFYVIIALFAVGYLSLYSPFYGWIFALAVIAIYITMLQIMRNYYTCSSGMMRVPVFFLITLAAALVAWFKFLQGERYFIWQPTKRNRA